MDRLHFFFLNNSIYRKRRVTVHLKFAGFDVNAVTRALMVKQNYESPPLLEDGLMLLLVMRCGTKSLS